MLVGSVSSLNTWAIACLLRPMYHPILPFNVKQMLVSFGLASQAQVTSEMDIYLVSQAEEGRLGGT